MALKKLILVDLLKGVACRQSLALDLKLPWVEPLEVRLSAIVGVVAINFPYSLARRQTFEAISLVEVAMVSDLGYASRA